MRELKNELLKQIKIVFMIICANMVYILFKSKFVSSTLRFHADTKNSPFRKQLVYFDQLWYKTPEEKQPLSGVLLKPRRKSFINSFKTRKVDLKFKQKPGKINVKDFVLCSVARTIPLIWNTVTCSNKLPTSSNIPSLKVAAKN